MVITAPANTGETQQTSSFNLGEWVKTEGVTLEPPKGSGLTVPEGAVSTMVKTRESVMSEIPDDGLGYAKFVTHLVVTVHKRTLGGCVKASSSLVSKATFKEYVKKNKGVSEACFNMVQAALTGLLNQIGSLQDSAKENFADDFKDRLVASTNSYEYWFVNHKPGENGAKGQAVVEKFSFTPSIPNIKILQDAEAKTDSNEKKAEHVKYIQSLFALYYVQMGSGASVSYTSEVKFFGQTKTMSGEAKQIFKLVYILVDIKTSQTIGNWFQAIGFGLPPGVSNGEKLPATPDYSAIEATPLLRAAKFVYAVRDLIGKDPENWTKLRDAKGKFTLESGDWASFAKLIDYISSQPLASTAQVQKEIGQAIAQQDRAAMIKAVQRL